MMRIIGVSLILIQVLILVESVPQSDKSVVKRDVNGSCDCGLIKNPYLEVLRGRDGRDGIPGKDGVKGERGNTGDKGERGEKGSPGPNNGGVVYIRWGKTTCPNTGAELVYKGIAGGSLYSHSGGGANYLCLPKDPQYPTTAVPPYRSYMYGAEYHDDNTLFSSIHNHNVPCAACFTSSKFTKLMIPAKTTCPTSWTREYYGHLMAGYYDHKNNVVYECVDRNAKSIPFTSPDTDGALFYSVTSTCTALPCPPYVNNKVIACVLCTK